MSAVAWWRSDRDAIFWIGLLSNVLLVLGAITFLYEGT
jgi:hypothetical protein